MSSTGTRTGLFASWEESLRGWDVYRDIVKLEPTFTRCPKDDYHHLLEIEDDGRHSTLLSRFADTILMKKQPEQVAVLDESEANIPEFLKASGHMLRTEYHLLLPQDVTLRQSLIGHIFSALHVTHAPLSFEIIGTHEEISVLISCSDRDAQRVKEQLTAHAPDCVIHESSHYLSTHFDRYPGEQCTVDFGLEHEVMRPLRTGQKDYDALTSIMGALSNLYTDECGVLQFLFEPVRHDWGSAFMDAVTNYDGSSFFLDAPEMVSLTKQKVDSPLLGCVIRVGGAAQEEERSTEIARSIGSTLMQLCDPRSNSLIPLNNDGYDGDYQHAEDLMYRQSRRSSMMLSLDELTTIVHFPTSTLRIPKLKRTDHSSKKAPALTRGNALRLGVNTHAGITEDVSLSVPQRMRHLHIVGASGTGKTTLLLHMITQDMAQGNGIAVLDPHGDLIDTILRYIPAHRMQDVIVFDPSDEGYPIGFNILDAKDDTEKTLLASDLVSVFKRLSSAWGDQMNSVFANAIIAMLESDEGGTLPILRRFLVDQHFRKDFLTTVKDPDNVFYWEREFPLLSGKPQGPVLTRLDTFLRPKPIRYMVAQRKNNIDFSQIMQGKKIFLAKLAQGAIGKENAHLLGSFLMSKMTQAAFARQSLPEEGRIPFYLYADEAHNFVTPSMEEILSGTRKYGLSLTLAHQGLKQLESRDSDTAASIIANPYTRIVFRVGDDDARKLQSGFSYFGAQDVQSLSIGKAIARVEQAAYDFNLTTQELDPPEEGSEGRSKEIIQHSREIYGTPKDEVEKLLYAAVGKKRPEGVPPHVLPEPLAGRGGKTHKRLQQKVKLLGEKAGFVATIEKRLDGGSGHVDVVLEKSDVSIAVEISVTTDPKHELKNIQKCLKAGFSHVIATAVESERLEALRKLCERLQEAEKQKVYFLGVSEIEGFLGQFRDDATRMQGYAVRASYEMPDKQKANALKRDVMRVLFGGK